MSPGPHRSTGYASVDGHLTPLEQARVPVIDRGLLLGDAVFETLRTYEGRLFALQEHLDRLEASLHAIHIEDPPSRDTIAKWARGAASAVRASARETGEGDPMPECVVRISVTRGDGPHGISTRGTGPPRVIVIARPLPPPPERVYQEGLHVVTASVKRAPAGVQDPTIKATSALNLILARLEADRQGADEALLTDQQGHYLEASAANLFVLREKTYWTPRGEHGVLEGVTARIIEQLLDGEGWTPKHGPIPRGIIRSAQEILLTQTTREVLPVVRVDDEPVDDGTPGPMSFRLRERFHEHRARLLDV